MKKFIHIGGDSRSGGSLLARLFDGHPYVLSYPFENEFFQNRNEDLINFKLFRQTHEIKSLEKPEVVNKIRKFSEQKLVSKQFYGEDSLKLNYQSFISAFKGSVDIQSKDSEIFDALHKSFFRELYSIDDFEQIQAVSNHCSRTFLGNIDEFFKVFTNGHFVQTIRSIKSVCASMKNYSYVALGKESAKLPSDFIDKVVERWILALYIGLLNANKFEGKYHLVSYDDIVSNPENSLMALCRNLDIDFHEDMLIPKYGNTKWRGNSSFGKLPTTISKDALNKYKSVLTKDDINKLDDAVGKIEIMFHGDYNVIDLLSLVKKEIHSFYTGSLGNMMDIRSRFNSIHNYLRFFQLKV